MGTQGSLCGILPASLHNPFVTTKWPIPFRRYPKKLRRRMSVAVDASSVHVNLGDRSYEIRIVSGGLSELPVLLPAWLDRSVYRAGNSRLAHIVTDRNVRRHADVVREGLTRTGWNCGLTEVEPGEKTKSVSSLATVWDDLIAARADRRTTVIAVGGGVVGDLAGFAAASFVRGLPFVQVPTSLLADVDSSVATRHSGPRPRRGQRPRNARPSRIAAGTVRGGT